MRGHTNIRGSRVGAVVFIGSLFLYTLADILLSLLLVISDQEYKMYVAFLF